MQTSFAHRLEWFNGAQIEPFCTHRLASNDFVEPVLERFSRGASIAQRIAHGVTFDTRGQTSCPPYQAFNWIDFFTHKHLFKFGLYCPLLKSVRQIRASSVWPLLFFPIENFGLAYPSQRINKDELKLKRVSLQQTNGFFELLWGSPLSWWALPIMEGGFHIFARKTPSRCELMWYFPLSYFYFFILYLFTNGKKQAKVVLIWLQRHLAKKKE